MLRKYVRQGHTIITKLFYILIYRDHNEEMIEIICFLEFCSAIKQFMLQS